MRPPRPWLFDVAFTLLLVALVVTAAVLAADLVCIRFIDQPNGCSWPWIAHDTSDL